MRPWTVWTKKEVEAECLRLGAVVMVFVSASSRALIEYVVINMIDIMIY